MKLTRHTSGAEVILDVTAVAAVNGKFLQFDFPNELVLKDFTVNTLGGGIVYVYTK